MMLIKDQIRIRRESLGMTMDELAQRCGVTEQAVRHWESGRSEPGKKIRGLVEKSLKFQLDWSEGQQPSGKTAASSIDEGAFNLAVKLYSLPLHLRKLQEEIVDAQLEMVRQIRGITPPPAPIKLVPALKPAPNVKKSVARPKAAMS